MSVRAPAVPLIVHDPFLSIWSPADHLTDAWPAHWTGRTLGLCGMARIDGTAYRWMGPDTFLSAPLPAMEQTGLRITPTRTIYAFTAGGVDLEVEFVTPALPEDPDVLSRPVTYVSLSVRENDGGRHEVQLYLDVPAALCSDQAEAPVIWGRHCDGPVTSLWVGLADQRPLLRGGDEILADWGYLHLSPDPRAHACTAIGEARSLRGSFALEGCFPDRDGTREGGDLSMPCPASGGEMKSPAGLRQLRTPITTLAAAHDVGDTGTWNVAIAYDQVWMAEYHHRRLRPLWRRNHVTAISLLRAAWDEREALFERCTQLDSAVTRELADVGGEPLARLGALAWRQCLGGHALVADRDGTLLHFSKENSSNGCMGTVDLTYPAAPFFLLFAPELLTAQLRFILDYAAAPDWPFPYAPHDIGRYPLANGQVYGGGAQGEENQMPYEECGNMLILAAALIKQTGGGLREDDWPVLRGWADYLATAGYDPQEQLSTDDFDGHMAHNVNLSAKAIVALGAASLLAEHFRDDGAMFASAAQRGAEAWLACRRSGAHWPMRFDEPDSWSLKYNLIWDRVLGLDLFPPSVGEAEIHCYREAQATYGTPLYSAARHTKLDWLVWAACLSGRRDDLDAILAPLGRWLDETPDRVPLSDWFDADTGRLARGKGFKARPVVGGIFLPLLLARQGKLQTGDTA
ncbi:glutaminase domain-containing protein [Halovulum sp. GXIMD14794]